jgi:hypothetical protein
LLQVTVSEDAAAPGLVAVGLGEAGAPWSWGVRVVDPEVAEVMVATMQEWSSHGDDLAQSPAVDLDALVAEVQRVLAGEHPPG